MSKCAKSFSFCGTLSPDPYWSFAPGPHCHAGTRDTDSWLDDTDNNFRPKLHLPFKIHNIWSVDSRENY